MVGTAPYLPTSRVFEWEPLARHTTLGLGGPADLYIEVGSPEDLKRILLFAAERELPLFLLGNGSNVAFSDEGFRGIVIRLGGAFQWVQIEPPQLQAGAGMPLPRVLREAANAGLSGLEPLVGVPGTVGGALVTNAGTRKGSIGDAVRQVHCLDRVGTRRVLDAAEAGFRYRGSLLGELVVVGAKFELQPAPTAEIEQRMAELQAQRRKAQPANDMSAGCVFRNPPGAAAGRLLDELGFKGRRVGGAMVSEKHANFVLNDGSATRQDFDDLIAAMRAAVRENHGYELELEVLRVGPFGPE